jgi:hypothetical protein
LQDELKARRRDAELLEGKMVGTHQSKLVTKYEKATFTYFPE